MENDFSAIFHQKHELFWHGAFLTPQKLEDEKVLTNLCMQRGEKRKKREEGVFHRQNGCQKICFGECYDICFLNICEKHPLVGENCIQSLKKVLQISHLSFLDAGGRPNIRFINSLSLSMFSITFLVE